MLSRRMEATSTLELPTAQSSGMVQVLLHSKQVGTGIHDLNNILISLFQVEPSMLLRTLVYAHGRAVKCLLQTQIA